MTADLTSLAERLEGATGTPTEAPATTPPPCHDEPDFDNEYDEEDELYLDECGMGPDGQCSMAGSEWCDWDCPLDKLRRRALSNPKART